MVLNENYKLRNYQQDSVSKLGKLNAALDLSDMGTGKTLVNIATLMQEFNTLNRVLILCPVKALYIWQNELSKFYNVDSIIYHGTIPQRKKIKPKLEDYKIIITTISMSTDLLSEMSFDYCIIDEYHELGLMNHKNNAFLKLKQERNKLKKLFLLSGTPIRKGVIDLYAPLHLLYPKIFKSYWQYVNKYCITLQGPFGKEIEGRPKDVIGFRKMLEQISVRNMKKEVLKELPDKTRQIVLIEPTKYQIKCINDLVTTNFLEIGDNLIVSSSAMTILMHIRQLLVSPQIFGESNDIGAGIPIIITEMENAFIGGDNAVVFYTPFIEGLNIFQRECKSKGWNTYILKGGMKPQDFTSTVEAFCKDKKNNKVLICSIKAAASFTATIASKCWFLGYEEDFNYDIQAEDRLCRFGQTQGVMCYYVMHKNTIDEDIAKRLNKKVEASDWIIGSSDILKMLRSRYKIN